MIAFRTLTATGTATNTFTEDNLGQIGSGNDWNGFVLDATSANINVRLPAVSDCTGKVFTFTTVNPTPKTVTVLVKSGTTNKINWGGAQVTSLATSTNYCTVTLLCDGITWWVLVNDGFA